MTTKRDVLDAALRQDLSAFIEKSFQTVAPGETYAPNWHIECIAGHLRQCVDGDIRRLIITLPPRHLKSICASVAFPAWVLGKDPTRKIICASYSSDLARKHAVDSRSVMESDWYGKLFPKTRIDPQKNTEQEMKTTRKGFRYSTSLGGTLAGRGGNLIIIDDPIKPGDAMSEAERARVKQWYDGTLYSRLDNKRKDVIVLLMQRVHVDDLVDHVLEKENWVHLNIPAIAEREEKYRIADDADYIREAGELLHPEREDEDALEDIKTNLGSYHFAAQYQQCPVPPGGNMIQWRWLRTYEEVPDPSKFDRVVQSWDTASETNELNDYSVCTTWGVKGPDYYLIDVVRERLEYPDLKRRVIAEARKQEAPTVLIEYTGSGISLVQEFCREGPIRPIRIKPKGDKILRMSTQTAKIEAGRVLIPERAHGLYEFQTEVLAFPHGRHDDQVDSMAQFLKWIDVKQWQELPWERKPGRVRKQGRPRKPGRRKRDDDGLLVMADPYGPPGSLVRVILR